MSVALQAAAIASMVPLTLGAALFRHGFQPVAVDPLAVELGELVREDQLERV